MKTRIQNLAAGTSVFLLMTALPTLILAQSGDLEGTIESSIRRLILVINLLLVGAIAWTGFLFAKGEHSAVHRLIYCVVGLIVVNSAGLIIDFFRV